VKCTRTVDAGAYVLGALAPTDRAAYERHMAGCPECRDEVAELAVLPGLLGRLDAATAVTTLSTPPAEAPAGLLAATLRAATTERRRYRRRHRWQLAVTGVAAACLAMALGLGAMTVSGEPRQPATPVLAQMTSMDPSPSIFALIGYSVHNGVTQISGVCLYENQPQVDKAWDVHLYVVDRDGNKHDLTQWSVGGPNYDSDSAQPFSTHTNLLPTDIKEFQLTNSVGQELLWYKVT
jgi:anti-sigma-K factor RskA